MSSSIYNNPALKAQICPFHFPDDFTSPFLLSLPNFAQAQATHLLNGGFDFQINTLLC